MYSDSRQRRAIAKNAARTPKPVLVIGNDLLFGASVMIALRHEQYDVPLVDERDHDSVLREIRHLPRGLALLDLDRSSTDAIDIDRFALLDPLLAEGWAVLISSSGTRAWQTPWLPARLAS